MSYSSLVNDLDPYFYFPMEIKENLIPLDVAGSLEPSIEGDYGYEQQKKFFSDPINILEGSYFILQQSSDFSAPSSTYSFWFDSDLVEDITEIFSIHDNISGVGLSYSKINSEFIIKIYGGSSFSVEYELKDPILVTFIASSSGLVLYLNDEIVLTVGNFTLPSEPTLALGTLNSLQGLGDARIADFFYVQSEISIFDVKSLYSLGFNGYEVFSLDSGSTITINDLQNDFLQTAWQSYGEITTKK